MSHGLLRALTLSNACQVETQEKCPIRYWFLLTAAHGDTVSLTPHSAGATTVQIGSCKSIE